ncbi:MAG: methylated-DNA--[protein]-cysteine S-methyltransferase [Sandaracinaceae bacterium]|nr:methylated-DNA--[protein]-cysteine S-methyltransferase [Sandaracinaceae bacterium]
MKTRETEKQERRAARPERRPYHRSTETRRSRARGRGRSLHREGLQVPVVGLGEAGLVEVSFGPFEWLETVGSPRARCPRVRGRVQGVLRRRGRQLHALPRDARGTPFQHQVWEALCRIPRGAVRSYSGVASDIGNPRAMRAVGLANGRNPLPIVVPCHRVIAASHQLGGYTGGLDRKRALLALEGVRIEATSCARASSRCSRADAHGVFARHHSCSSVTSRGASASASTATGIGPPKLRASAGPPSTARPRVRASPRASAHSSSASGLSPTAPVGLPQRSHPGAAERSVGQRERDTQAHFACERAERHGAHEQQTHG